MEQPTNSNLSQLLSGGKTETSSEAVFDASCLAVRTVVNERFVFNSTTRQIELHRTLRDLTATINWEPGTFNDALRWNILNHLENYYTFVEVTSETGSGLYSDKTETVIVTPEESSVFVDWASMRRAPTKKEKASDVDPESLPTKGEVLARKTARFSRFVAQIDSEKLRLRALTQHANVTNSGGTLDSIAVGSRAEIDRIETGLEELNREVVKVFHDIETALTQLNDLSGEPTITPWLVQLPAAWDELTRLNTEEPPEFGELLGATYDDIEAVDDEEDEEA